ncbi:MAG: M23 family metallopeptidase [Patescibacteria group bacterium]|nr:M23 family metallopeptidase [Patescibacteria group bacterium]
MKNLYYPVQYPINQNNLFGAPESYAQATGQKGHPGVDFECPMYTKVLAPCDGDAFSVGPDVDGGCGIYIRVPNNAKPEANVILWHMVPAGNADYPYSIPTGRGMVTPVKAGDFLGYSGDSGYPKESSGPHLHFGYMPSDFTGAAADPNNGYDGCVDPMPFFNGIYAGNIPKLDQAIQASEEVVQAISAAPIAVQQKQTLLSILKVAWQKFLDAIL